MSSEELKRFYKAKVKKPNLFNYDDSGNLIELNKEGSIIKTISLPNYRLPTYEEFDEMELQRTEAIAIANKEFEKYKKELRDTLTNTDIPQSEVLRINRKVKEADIKLQSIRFPLQYIEQEDGISINQIDFDKTFEKRKYPYPFYFLNERPYILQEQYTRIGKAAIKPMISIAEIKAANELSNTSIVILFADPETNDYGFLSLKWVVEIEFNGTMYNSAHQAISAEIAKGFNDQQNLQKIMIADTPDEITYTLEDVSGDSDANETKWNDLTKQLIYDVNISKFNQYPELSARLLETQNSKLGAYLPDDNLIGIGISLDNIKSKNPINWTGQNLLGKALMDIRDKIRSDRNAAISQQTLLASQPIPRRKKPSIAITQPSITEIPNIIQPPSENTIQPSITEIPNIIQPPSENTIPSVIPSVIPRTIRRRPQISISQE
jgi:ribA/ribD-fused uncharacterized protein